jgi:hypothetical protein
MQPLGDIMNYTAKPMPCFTFLPQELLGRQYNRPKAEALKDPSTVALAEGPKAKKMLGKAEK